MTELEVNLSIEPSKIHWDVSANVLTWTNSGLQEIDKVHFPDLTQVCVHFIYHKVFDSSALRMRVVKNRIISTNESTPIATFQTSVLRGKANHNPKIPSLTVCTPPANLFVVFPELWWL